MTTNSQMPTFGVPETGIAYEDRPGSYALILNPDKELALLKTSFGVFLPGGGLDSGEDGLTGLSRELHEEMGAQIKTAQFLGQAAQYLYSRHYQRHFRKIGSFYQVELWNLDRLQLDSTHKLIWFNFHFAAQELSEEYQRWAVGLIPRPIAAPPC